LSDFGKRNQDNYFPALNTDTRLRTYQQEAMAIEQPTRPRNWFSQAYATATAIAREATYPVGLYKLPRGFRWLTPPPLGRSIMIVLYMTMILSMLLSFSIEHDVYYYERLGFRAAWISIMQIPFIILLSGKANIIGLLVGSSYERLNWLHRWTSRVLLFTVTFHGGFFYREWIKADFVKLEFQYMPIVKFGIAAWFLLIWMNVSGLTPIRHVAYEFFVIQHIVCGAVFIYLIYQHSPSYARHFIWISIGFLVFDRVARLVWFLFRNIHFRRSNSETGRLGYPATLEATEGNVTVVNIEGVDFSWHPGQHVYIWVPAIGLVESHPFTISNCYRSSKKNSQSISLAVRAHSGFSKRLYKKAASAPSGGQVPARIFIQGPYGKQPSWNTYESLLLISASTGTSFTLPILESIIADPCCVRRVYFLLLVRQRPHCGCYLDRLKRATSKSHSRGLEVIVKIAVSGESSIVEKDAPTSLPACCCGPPDENGNGGCCCCDDSDSSSAMSVFQERATSHVSDIRPQGVPGIQSSDDAIVDSSSEKRSSRARISKKSKSSATSAQKEVGFSSGKVQVSKIIRSVIEEAEGETCIAVCGGPRLTSDVRNCVARISDDRAVHKGSGAQGIFLHVEEFGM
jgi:NAD(P)H-flavin reductase